MKIEDYSFGSIVIDGRVFSSDIKIIDGQVIASWWRKNGHSVEEADVADIITAAPEIVILGKGKPGLMKATNTLCSRFADLGIALIEKPSADAAGQFNRLIEQGKRVAAGFHLTC